MNRILANLLIVIAFLLLAWAYRLKQKSGTVVPPKTQRRRSPSRFTLTGWAWLLFPVMPAVG